MKDTIEQLVRSGDSINRTIAMQLMVGMSKEEVRKLFNFNHGNAHTLLHKIEILRHSERFSYRVSEDCIVYLGYNMSIIDTPHYQHIDLTI